MNIAEAVNAIKRGQIIAATCPIDEDVYQCLDAGDYINDEGAFDEAECYKDLLSRANEYQQVFDLEGLSDWHGTDVCPDNGPF